MLLIAKADRLSQPMFPCPGCRYHDEMTKSPSSVTVRPAVASDVPAVHDLIQFHAQRGRMILRGYDELYADLRSFIVAQDGSEVVGCASVHIFWSDLAELKCVAVREDRQHRGIGRAVVDACHTDLRRLGIKKAFTLTSATEFFERLGYRVVAKDSLPRFIWGECVRCPSFPVCNEEALVFDLA
jgi:amino-acid N-acetyltransferase